MTASERFRRFLAGEPVDRSPAIEWAPWWRLTVERWHGEGMPEEIKSVEQIQEYFGLDKCLQTSVTCKTAATPRPAGHGLGIMEDEEDWAELRKTLFPPVETVLSEARFAELERRRARGDTLQFFTVEGFFWYPRTLFGIENHLYSFYDYPELYPEMCEAYADWLIELFRYVFSRFRFDFMSFAEDMSYNLGPMISRECFEEFLAPFTARSSPSSTNTASPFSLTRTATSPRRWIGTPAWERTVCFRWNGRRGWMCPSICRSSRRWPLSDISIKCA